MKKSISTLILLLAGAFFYYPSAFAQGSFESLLGSDISSIEVPEAAAARADEPAVSVSSGTRGIFTYSEQGEDRRRVKRLVAADLLPQFADTSNRDQGSVGSCHAFGGMAVLEAAYFRAHGTKVSLSEADIFIRRTVMSKDWYRDFCAGGSCKVSEGNDTLGDLTYAKEHGVATSVQYDRFLERYTRHRKAEQLTLEGIAKQQSEMSWLERVFYNPRTHWAELQESDSSRRITQMFLAGRDPRIEAERAEIKGKIKDFRIENASFRYLGSSVNSMTRAARLAAGAGQKRLILAELAAGRPVTVSMSLSNLPGWGQTDTSQHANHAFLIIGFSEAAGVLAFQTRNSWGGVNPGVSEDELCRIYGIITVKVPGE